MANIPGVSTIDNVSGVSHRVFEKMGFGQRAQIPSEDIPVGQAGHPADMSIIETMRAQKINPPRWDQLNQPTRVVTQDPTLLGLIGGGETYWDLESDGLWHEYSRCIGCRDSNPKASGNTSSTRPHPMILPNNQVPTTKLLPYDPRNKYPGLYHPPTPTPIPTPSPAPIKLIYEPSSDLSMRERETEMIESYKRTHGGSTSTQLPGGLTMEYTFAPPSTKSTPIVGGVSTPRSSLPIASASLPMTVAYKQVMSPLSGAKK